jgi:hypothetical protein
MAAPDLSRANWRKSTRSNGGGACVEVAAIWRKSRRSANGSNCVEIADLDMVVAVRDSKNPEGATLAIPSAAWRSFTAAIKNGSVSR